MKNNLKKYIVFWLSQSVSQLGSAMTGYALILWVYTIKHSALTVSLMSFCNYVPYIVISLFAGTFVDRHSKKKIMLVSDGIAAICSALVLLLSFGGGLKFVLIIDLTSFAIAFLVLLFLIFIPEYTEVGKQNDSIFAGCKEGYVFLIQNKGIFMIVVTMALLNFFSRLTYENILSPMVLARSGDNTMALGVVNAVMGIGGILGGIIVSAGKISKENMKMIYVSAALSFLLGDLLMGVGRNPVMWSVAGLAASLPIPFINAGQNVVLYKKVPDEMQGRVFAVRNAIQFSTIPVGILLGGFLADYVFEPFMMSESFAASGLQLLVGRGQGSGMAVMFLCTGLMGCLFSLISYRRKEIQELREID